MKRLVVMVVAAGAALSAVAMPTKAELQKAQEMVNDVTSADVAALKAKSKTPAEVAAKHMELAGQAGNEAEKYLLLQGAFHLYVKGGDYDNAAKAIETMQAEIKDFNPEVIVELCSKALVRKMQDNAPKLYAIKENARRIVFYRRQLPIREAAVRKTPRDPQAQRKLAECHAELGDWPKALDVFVKAGGEFKKMSEGETSGKIPAQELGDFWWDYETKSDTQVYKLHAAELYRKALADNSFKGLARTRAEQRAKEVEKDAEVMAVGSSTAREVGQSRIAFKEGESFKIILDAKKNISVEFVACPPGEYVMSNEEQWRNTRHTVKITYPFFIMAWPATLQDADALVPKVGTHGREVYSPEHAKLLTGDTPITDISPADIAAFAEALSARMKVLPQFRYFSGYECRLPTEAEWCYVSRTNLNQSAKRGPSKGRDWFWSQRKKLGGLKYYEFPLWPIYVVREDFDLMTGNKWGVRYVWQNTMLADSYKDIFNGENSGRRPVRSVGTEIFGYSDEEINPIRICKDKVACSMGYDSWGSTRVFIRTGQLGSRDPIRFVFGPQISMLNIYPRTENDGPVKRIGEGRATVKKTIIDAKDMSACYPREDFGGVLLSSKYELMEFSGELRHVRYLDGLFNSRKTVEEPSDFAFGVCSNGKKEAGFTLKLSESVTLAGLLVVNRTKVTQERQVPLCVWASEDRVKWERVFIDESIRDEYRIDLSNKNITCKYLRFGRLPGVNNEPFHLARTLVYVKSSAAEKKAKR